MSEHSCVQKTPTSKEDTCLTNEELEAIHFEFLEAEELAKQTFLQEAFVTEEDEYWEFRKLEWWYSYAVKAFSPS